MHWLGGMLKSPAVVVMWAGFEAPAHLLQRCGWQFSVAETEYGQGDIEVLMRNPSEQILAHGFLSRKEADALRRDPYQSGRERSAAIRIRATTQLHFTEIRLGPRVSDFVPVDMAPHFVGQSEFRAMRPEELDRLFMPARVPERQIIVDRDDVSRMLALIVEAQQPAQKAHRKRLLAEVERGAPVQRHAQIVSLAA